LFSGLLVLPCGFIYVIAPMPPWALVNNKAFERPPFGQTPSSAGINGHIVQKTYNQPNTKKLAQKKPMRMTLIVATSPLALSCVSVAC